MTSEKTPPIKLKRILVSVAYAWDSSPDSNPTAAAQLDPRWNAIRRELSKYTIEAEKRAEKAGFPALKARIARLRGQTGQFTWPAITRRIDESDVVVVDLTPHDGTQHIAPNVLLELGYALARHPQRVFVVVTENAGHDILPSDLKGMIVGHYGRTHQDKSLRSSIVNAILAAAEEQ